MPRILVLLVLLFTLSSRVSSAQSLELYAAGGPTIVDTGHSLAVGAGFSPNSRWTLVFNFERTHLSSRTSFEDGVSSSFRGGTLYLGTAEVRFSPLGRGRLGPYALAGFAEGVSRPNVNERFPNRVSNHARAIFFGGGVEVPLNQRVSVFADGRLMGGAEGVEGIIAVLPIRAGVNVRF